jgi:hypothetical protein
MIPQPWSPTTLSEFVTCPEMYHHRRVLKDVEEAPSLEQTEGKRVHKAFELRQIAPAANPLPADLVTHEPYMQRLEAKPGVFWTEQRAGIDRKLRPCSWEQQDIWYRSVIDYLKVEDQHAFITDYKTGKPHAKKEQLASYALYVFLAHPDVELVNAQYYWTKTQTVTKFVWSRAEMDMLWGYFTGDLKQWMTAFKTDTWQTRPSGLCYGWCPVKTCSFWKPKKAYQQ